MQAARQEIGPPDVPQQGPVKGGARAAAAGVQQDHVRFTLLRGGHVRRTVHAEGLDDGPVRQAAKSADIGRVLPAVELGDVNDALPQQGRHLLRLLPDKDAHRLNRGMEALFQCRRSLRRHIALAFRREHKADVRRQQPVGLLNVTGP